MARAPGTQRAIRAIAQENRLFQPSDVPGPPNALAQAERHGRIARIIPGVYLGAEHPQHPLIEAAAWVLRHPLAVAGLLTAAVHYDLTTAFARGTWLFVPTRTTLPRSRTRHVHAIQTNLRFINPDDDEDNGIVTLRVHEVDLRLTNPDRTVLDLLRYPQHVSAEHGLEALRRRVAESDFRVPAFARLARRLGAWNDIDKLVQGLMLR